MFPWCPHGVGSNPEIVSIPVILGWSRDVPLVFPSRVGPKMFPGHQAPSVLRRGSLQHTTSFFTNEKPMKRYKTNEKTRENVFIGKKQGGEKPMKFLVL